MILSFIIAVGLLTVLWNRYYRRCFAGNITARLMFDTNALYAGDETKLYEVIENQGTMPVPVLEVGFHTKKGLDFAGTDNTSISDYIYKRDIFAAAGRQKITREIPVKCPRRGYYEIRETELVTYSLLYGKRLGRTLACGAAIHVYPGNTHISDILPLCQRMLDTAQCARRLYEDPFAFRAIRDYTINDPMKTINWKASAKTGNLMVNTFDSTLSRKAMLYLDVEDSGILKYPDLTEESISLAATLARKLTRQGIEVGFCFNGGKAAALENGFAPTNKKDLLIRMEHMLAEYLPENGTHSYETEIRGYAAMADTVQIFITKNLTSALYGMIKKYAVESQTLMICPVYRGEAPPKDVFPGGSREKIRILIREVDRE